jgi:hypothetical protein
MPRQPGREHLDEVRSEGDVEVQAEDEFATTLPDPGTEAMTESGIGLQQDEPHRKTSVLDRRHGVIDKTVVDNDDLEKVYVCARRVGMTNGTSRSQFRLTITTLTSPRWHSDSRFSRAAATVEIARPLGPWAAAVGTRQIP